MRAGKMPLDAISGTVGFFDGASKVMKGLANAAQAVVDEASKTAQWHCGCSKGRCSASEARRALIPSGRPSTFVNVAL